MKSLTLPYRNASSQQHRCVFYHESSKMICSMHNFCQDFNLKFIEIQCNFPELTKSINVHTDNHNKFQRHCMYMYVWLLH